MEESGTGKSSLLSCFRPAMTRLCCHARSPSIAFTLSEAEVLRINPATKRPQIQPTDCFTLSTEKGCNCKERSDDKQSDMKCHPNIVLSQSPGQSQEIGEGAVRKLKQMASPSARFDSRN